MILIINQYCNNTLNINKIKIWFNKKKNHSKISKLKSKNKKNKINNNWLIKKLKIYILKQKTDYNKILKMRQ